MNISRIYRKRFIPAECVLLKDDIIVMQDEEVIVTKWNTLNPKAAFSHGCSCYFLTDGIKLSKFYRSDNTGWIHADRHRSPCRCGCPTGRNCGSDRSG